MATKQPATKFAASKPALTRAQCLDTICSNYATKRSIIFEGDTGSGKTDMGMEAAKRLGMRMVYNDCTTMQLEDLTVPWMYEVNGMKLVQSVPHENFGIQFHEPILLVFDEVGKNRSLLPPLARVFHERKIGNYQLPVGSRVIGFTNLGSENFGDSLAGFIRSRVNLVRYLKPDAQTWLSWGAQNNIVPALLAAAHEMPQMFESFTDVENPQDNPYINDPRDAGRTAFVTHRSLHHLSDLLHDRDTLGYEATLNNAIGIVGAKAAHDIMTMVTLGDTLPKYVEIVATPDKIKVPNGVGAQIMSALTCMQRVEAEEFTAVFTYIKRLPMEIQALFANQLMKSSSKAIWVSRNAAFTEFARKNFNLFTQ